MARHHHDLASATVCVFDGKALPRTRVCLCLLNHADLVAATESVRQALRSVLYPHRDVCWQPMVFFGP